MATSTIPRVAGYVNCILYWVSEKTDLVEAHREALDDIGTHRKIKDIVEYPNEDGTAENWRWVSIPLDLDVDDPEKLAEWECNSDPREIGVTHEVYESGE